MGKRSSFKRRARDFYPTPVEAVRPLVPYLPRDVRFIEPCAGAGDLVTAMRKLLPHCECVYASDIDPQAPGIAVADMGAPIPFGRADMVITNGPWTTPGRQGEPVLGMIAHFTAFLPTWLLLPADFAHNLYFSNVADRCKPIVSIGRVSWEGNGRAGKDNSAWYLFDSSHSGGPSFKWRSSAHSGQLNGEVRKYA